MGKQIIQSYSFNALSQTVVLYGYTILKLENLQLITNVTRNTILYNFASPTYGATVSGNTITLEYDTTTMEDSDALQIIYDDGQVGTTFAEQQVQSTLLEQIRINSALIGDLTVVVRSLQQATVDPPYLDKSINAIRNQVQSGTINTVTTVTTVNTVNTVGTVTNTTNIDTYQGKLLVLGQDIAAWATTVRSRIS